jgi:hypothetical protein
LEIYQAELCKLESDIHSADLANGILRNIQYLKTRNGNPLDIFNSFSINKIYKIMFYTLTTTSGRGDFGR